MPLCLQQTKANVQTIPFGNLSRGAQGSFKTAANCIVLSNKLPVSEYYEAAIQSRPIMTAYTAIIEWRHKMAFL